MWNIIGYDSNCVISIKINWQELKRPMSEKYTAENKTTE